MLLFKQKSQDFIVTEELPFELEGKGDAFYVLFEKRNLNTMDVVNHLCKKFKISRLTLGIAGLKDKKAITRQWISIYDRALKKLGGEKVFVEGLSEVVKVLKRGRHSFPLNMSTPISNTFHIRLRGERALGAEEKKDAKEGIEKIFHDGFSNKFGEQRFGIDGRNWMQGLEILNGLHKNLDKKEIVFKLQSYGSKLFNDFVSMRLKNKMRLIDGDILLYNNSYGVYSKENNTFQPVTLDKESTKAIVNPLERGKAIPYDWKTMFLTAPVLGHNILLPYKKTAAGKLEGDFMKERKIKDKHLKVFREKRVFGLRRQARVYPTNTKVTRQGDDMLMMFTLPSGAYASIIIDIMMKRLEIKEEKKEKKSNRR